MKYLLLTLSILIIRSTFSSELQELYFFPHKGESSFKFSSSLKEFEVEYDDKSVNLTPGDIQEFDQQVLILEPTYKYSITNNFLLQLSFKYQTKDLSTHFEDIFDNEYKTNTIHGLFDPTLELRYRAIEKDLIFVDIFLNQIFKTNTYAEGNRTRQARPYSGKNTSTIAGEVGYLFKNIQLRTNLHIDFYSQMSSQFALLDDVFRSDFTYSIGYGAEVLIRLNQQLNWKFAFDASTVNAYDMKSTTQNIHIDEVLMSSYRTSLEYKKFEKSFAIISIDFTYKAMYNRVTYSSSDLRSDTKTMLTTLTLEKRFK
ncbi:hypothetical protein [Halobacteriovorax sp. HLS]|uniref:hypothetical protein n=1 Tax=Halobacteriovorax sp. HLS TaxID=2234000 RepID=UPI000FDBD0EE|nr:hypothetical protein [Halobacteriovorax sp. HLS]